MDRANWIYAEAGEDSKYLAGLYALTIQNMYLINNKSNQQLYFWGMRASVKGKTVPLDKDEYLKGKEREGTSKTGSLFWATRNGNEASRTESMLASISAVMTATFLEEETSSLPNQWLGGSSGQGMIQINVKESGSIHRFYRLNTTYGKAPIITVEKGSNCDWVDIYQMTLLKMNK